MSRKLIFGAAALAIAATVPYAPARAEDRTGADKPITIIAPQVEHRRGPDSVAKIRTLTASAIVTTDDLALDTEVGRRLLEQRVLVAAMDSCKSLDDLYPLDSPSGGEAQCVHNAIDSARPQMLAAYTTAR